MIGLSLTDKQQKTVAAAITLLSAMFILSFVLAAAWLIARFVHAFSGVVVPLAVAAILAFMLKPYYLWLHARLGGPAVFAVLAVFATVLVPIGLFLWFFGALLFEQLSGFLGKIPVWWEAGRNALREHGPAIVEFWEKHGLQERLRSALQKHGDILARVLQAATGRLLAAGANLFSAIASLLSWLVLPVYLAFFLMAKPIEPKSLEGMLPFLKPDTRRDVVYLIQEFLNILVAFFRGQFVIALLQGLIFAVGFSLVGLQYGFVLGLILGFLNIVPYLGNMIGLVVTLPLAYAQAGGGWLVVALVLLVFAVVQVTENLLLTPRIMGKRTGLHPLAIIVAILFWGSALGGLAGMILAIPLTAFVVVFWRLAKAKYITEIV